jgi:hypothetical protein
MAKPKRPPGPPMTLGNMREMGVARLIASCLSDACRHTALNRGNARARSSSIFDVRRTMTDATQFLCRT